MKIWGEEDGRTSEARINQANARNEPQDRREEYWTRVNGEGKEAVVKEK